MATRAFRHVVAVCACALVGFAACGDDEAGAPPDAAATDRLGPARFDELTSRLGDAAPQGQVSAGQLAAAAPRQAAVATSFADTVAAGPCRTALQGLGAAYTRLGRAAGAAGGGVAEEDAYAAAAGAVGVALEAAEGACR